jgi:Fe-S-cluster containining protein
LIKCSLQEAEGIIYYLYGHADILNHFVKVFPAWLTETYKHGDVFKRTEEILSKPYEEQVNNSFNGSNAYWGLLHIPCPFLTDKQCSIYEVRPLTCVNLASNAECGKDENAKPFCLELGPELEQAFWDNRLSRPFFGIMPILVFKLLTGGFATLSKIPGLETLLGEFQNDPQVRNFALSLLPQK